MHGDSAHDQADTRELEGPRDLREHDHADHRRGRRQERHEHRVRGARETPQVVECHRITGEDCFFLKVHLRSLDELEPLLDRFTPYGRTTTSLIHSSPVSDRALPL